jgi:hypothetical protein
MEEKMILGFSLLTIALVAILFYALKVKGRLKALESKYSKVIDVDLEVDKSKKEKEVIDKKIESIRNDYKEKE